MKNNFCLFEAWVAKTPNAPAVITPGRTVGYATLNLEVSNLAHHLVTQGVRSGGRVAVSVSDDIKALYVILALARIGATLIAFPRSATSTQRDEWLSTIRIGVVIADHADGWRRETPVIAFDSWGMTASLPTGVDRVQAYEPQPAAPLMIMIGSGSTGTSKLLPLSHAQMRERAAVTRAIFGITPADRMATMVPLEYASSMHRLWATLDSGAAFVVMNPEGVQLRDLSRDFGITNLVATVSHAEKMLALKKDWSGTPIEGIQLTVAGSVVSDDLRKRIRERITPNLWVGYGTNEAWYATVATPDECCAHPGTVGRPAPGVEVRIVDADLNDVAPGKPGLIAIRSPQNISGYLADDGANQIAFRAGCFLPGDVGSKNANGHIIFLGRADNMMIFNGINIFPAEIERCLLAHPAVKDVVAMPLRHPVHQDVPVAVVCLQEGAFAAAQELQAHAKETLGVKAPQRIFVCPEIPRNLQGKPVKAALQDIIRQQMRAGPR